MSDLNLNNIIPKLVNNVLSSSAKSVINTAQSVVQSFTTGTQSANSFQGTSATANTSYQMGSMGGAGQAAYVRDVMQLPQNLNEAIYMQQNKMNYSQLNQQILNTQVLANRTELSQLQAQILSQLQGINVTQTATTQTNQTMLLYQLKNLPLSSSGMIQLSDVALMIQMNGKDAIAKLIGTIAAAAKLGITDVSQLKETAKLINASVAAASQNDGAQTMKMLLMLYLPWLPLQEGTGFDLEIDSSSSEEEGDSILIITITTINYGIVTATLILESSNSVHVSIECFKEFPKKELMMRIENDEKHYSMQSVVSFSESEQKPEQVTGKQETKINMSNTNIINPYLLLMSHTIIRHVIEIDRNFILGSTSHVD